MSVKTEKKTVFFFQHALTCLIYSRHCFKSSTHIDSFYLVSIIILQTRKPRHRGHHHSQNNTVSSRSGSHPGPAAAEFLLPQHLLPPSSLCRHAQNLLEGDKLSIVCFGAEDDKG